MNKFIVFWSVIFTLATSAAWAVPQYVVTDLGTLGGGSSWAVGINDSGQVVGYSPTAGGDMHAFLYSGGTMTDLGTLGGNYAQPYDINDSGQVVGQSTSANGIGHAFLYSDGTMIDLGTALAGYNSRATGITDSGQVVGYYLNLAQPHTVIYSNGLMIDIIGSISEANGINNSGQVVGRVVNHAFVYDNGVVTDLGTLGGPQSVAVAINNSSQVAGYSTVADGYDYHAFLYSGGVMVDLGTLGGLRSVAGGINDRGQVVGWSYSSGLGSDHAFLYSDGTMNDLNVLIDPSSGWTLVYAEDINSSGQIVGMGHNPQGETRAFLLTPIPEPGALALIVPALLGLGGVVLKRRK